MFRRPKAPVSDRSMPPGRKDKQNTAPGTKARGSSVPAEKRAPIVAAINAGAKAGAVTEEDLQKAFTDVPEFTVNSSRHFKETFQDLCTTLEGRNTDWSQRMTALKKLRSVVIGGALEYSDFVEEVVQVQPGLQTCLKDLRSQVCREACVTIAFYCKALGAVMGNGVEIIMPTLLVLLQNSAKVLSSSAQLALNYILKYVCKPKLLPHLQTAMTSKSKDIRSSVASLVLVALTNWDRRVIERNMSVFLDLVKVSLTDAAPETRATGRLLFVLLEQEFKPQADMLYKTLDSSTKRALSGYHSQSTSIQSIVLEKDGLPISRRPTAYAFHKANPSYYAGRSTSDIDTGAARRAVNQRSRAPPGVSTRQGTITPNPVQTRPNTAQRVPAAPHKLSSTVRLTGAVAPAVCARSQPGSRSTSPNSRHPTRTQPKPMLASARTRSEIVEDLEDRASVSSDSIRFESMDLANVLSCCASTTILEKKEGLKALAMILNDSSKQLTPVDVKKIVEHINPMISEGTHKLLQPVSDVVMTLIEKHHDELVDWLKLLIPKLVAKSTTEVLESNKEKYRAMLEIIRTKFDPEAQMLAVCKFICDPIRNSVSAKIKHGLLVYLHEIMRGMDSAPSMNQGEVRMAVAKIFQWVEDPKNAALTGISERIVCDMFHLNASDFASMLATYSNDLKDRLQAIVRKSSIGASTAGTMSSHDARAEILETSARINDFVDRRSGTGRTPVRSPPGIPNGTPRPIQENGQPRRPSREEQNGGSSVPYSSNAFPETSFCGNLIVDPQALAGNTDMQEELIAKIIQELSTPNQRSKEKIRAMAALSQVTRENIFDLWDSNFKLLFMLLMDSLKNDDAEVRRMALKLLKETCNAQARRFNEFAETALMRVLDACTDKSKYVCAAAEDCCSALVTHVSSVTCRRVLLAVIRSDGEPKVHIAIKMLTKVIESLGPAELEAILDEVAPPIIHAYNCESSATRKESVVCLVAMIMVVGEERISPYLSELNKGKQKLIDVYVKRVKGDDGT